jgi:hypothetical protein
MKAKTLCSLCFMFVGGVMFSIAPMELSAQTAIRPGFNMTALHADPNDPNAGTGENGDDGSKGPMVFERFRPSMYEATAFSTAGPPFPCEWGSEADIQKPYNHLLGGLYTGGGFHE